MDTINYYIRLFLSQKFEFADSKERAFQVIRGLAHPFSIHVCKLFLWGNQNEDWKKDWSEEIWNYLSQIKDIRLKPSNKTPKPKMYLEGLFDPFLETAEQMDYMLQTVAKDCIDEGYPIASHVCSDEAFKSYRKFVNEVQDRIQNHALSREFVLDACNRYLVLNQPY
jgi:hypothetical protein